MKKYPFHPAASIFPLNTDGPEFEAFVEDIKTNKLQQPIMLQDGKILDGRRRYIACDKAGVEPKFLVWDGQGVPVDYVLSANALRRHLTPSQLAVVAIKALPFYQMEAKNRQRLSKGRGNKGAQPCATLKGKASEWAAKKFGISVRIVEMAKKVQEADPKLIAEIEAGPMTVSEAAKVVAHRPGTFNGSSDTSLDDRFRTPPWLFKVLDDKYHFRLDACAESEVALCKTFYSPEQDGLRQNWAKHGSVFGNPPFHRDRLEEWVVKGFLEAQKGATVVMVLPYYKSYAWFRYVVIPFAEIRQIWGQVVFQGYGNQKGNCAGNKGKRTFDSIIAIFREGPTWLQRTVCGSPGQTVAGAAEVPPEGVLGRAFRLLEPALPRGRPHDLCLHATP